MSDTDENNLIEIQHEHGPIEIQHVHPQLVVCTKACPAYGQRRLTTSDGYAQVYLPQPPVAADHAVPSTVWVDSPEGIDATWRAHNHARTERCAALCQQFSTVSQWGGKFEMLHLFTDDGGVPRPLSYYPSDGENMEEPSADWPTVDWQAEADRVERDLLGDEFVQHIHPHGVPCFSDCMGYANRRDMVRRYSDITVYPTEGGPSYAVRMEIPATPRTTDAVEEMRAAGLALADAAEKYSAAMERVRKAVNGE